MGELWKYINTYCQPELTARYEKSASIGPSPSQDTSSKTNKGEPTHSHYAILQGSWQLGIAFRSFADSSWETFWLQIKIMFKYCFLLDLASDHSCCKLTTTVVTPLMLSVAYNVVNRVGGPASFCSTMLSHGHTVV